MALTGRDLLKATGGTVLNGSLQTTVKSFSIDTRTLQPGDWFIPLKGEQTDGENYIEDALLKGAVGAFTFQDFILGTENYELKNRPLLIKVPDTLKALQDVARYHRNKHSLEVIGVTGSSGKTTTKDLIASVLSQKYSVLKTEGNLNNEIGLPLMLLRITEKHEVAVLEMAMRGKGEIAFLSELALPRWGVITNIGEAHLEKLGSVEAIACAKGELLDNLSLKGVAVLNGDDVRLRRIARNFSGKAYWYGEHEHNDFIAEIVEASLFDTNFKVKFPKKNTAMSFTVSLPGKYNVMNSLAALSLGYLFGLKENYLRKGLQKSHNHLSWGRMEFKKGRKPGVDVIDDSYNANPSSVKSSLEVVCQFYHPGNIIAVLGDMLELGDISEKAHREIGGLVADHGIGCLVAVGDLSEYMAEEARLRGVKVYHCPNVQEAIQCVTELEKNIQKEALFLVKGSRGVMLDNLVKQISS